MSEPVKNPFDLLLDQIRAVVREEIKAASNGNGHGETPDDPIEILRKSIRDALSIGALLTAEQLAEVLQVNKATVYERVKSKTIPYYQAGRFIRFNLQEVLESQRKNNGNPS
jgi:excisionase family DNA binding protein